jgi:elongation factor Tu
MTMPPMDVDEPALFMPIKDVFRIKGRGTVVTGELQGEGLLSVGDVMLCDGQSWQVLGIERLGAVLNTAEPGTPIGVLISSGPVAPAMLRGKIAAFGPGTRFGPGTGFGPGAAGVNALFPALGPKKRRWRG